MSRISVLAGVCMLMTLSSSAVRAQAPSDGSLQPAPLTLAGAGVTRFQNRSAPVARESNAPSLVGSGRLGISSPPVAEAIASHHATAAVPAASLRHRGPGVALMIVGAAGVITGLLVDESILTVAGAGVGLFGLYLYLR